MSEPRDWDMLAKYLADEASAEEAREIQGWIDSDPENRLMVERLRASFRVSPLSEETSDLNVMWNRIAAEVGRSKYGITREKPRHDWIEAVRRALSLRPGWSFKPVIMTALAMATVVALVWFPYQAYWGDPELTTIRAPLGQTVSVVLHDGSRVVLDAGSELHHPVAFAGGTRQVTLDGQAYFQVQRDESRPFRVTAGAASVEVLGTAFEVTSWDEALTTVTVEEGRVRFGRSDSPDHQTVVLTANQMSHLDADGPPSSPASVDAARRLAWLRDEVFFDDAPLGDVLDRLHRWHNARIVVSESSLLDEHLTVHLVKSDLQGSLDLIGRILGMDVVRENSGYRFARRGGKTN